MLYQTLREEVLQTALVLKKFDLVWMAGGSVCARVPESGDVIVTPSGLPYEDLTAADMIVTTIDMKIIDGNYKPSVALNLWTAILKTRSDVNAILHTHSVYATAFSVTGEMIPIITETMADWFLKPIPVTNYAHVEDPRFVSEAVEKLGDGFAVLLGRHGPIVVGKDLKDSLERAVTLEEAAKVYAVAKSIGKPQVFSEKEMRDSFDFYMTRYGQK
jgi:L-ribulose-5-phosphate 4-epimerase